MVTSHPVSPRRAAASGRIPRGLRHALALLLMLVSAAALTVVLVVALVWTLWTLGLVLG